MIETKEQFKELYFDGYLVEVHQEIDDSWRHGNIYETVFEYVPVDEDGVEVPGGEITYWEASYRVSGDGEWHGIREDEFSYAQVWPHKKVIETTVWLRKPVDTAEQS
jgi:hypothetical protein